MAELGSLSMEFTRLAQLTKDDRYYDAIARITNELEAWQDNTKIPGLWPLYVDASGCKKSTWRQDSSWKQKLINPEIEEMQAAPHAAAVAAAAAAVAAPQEKKPAATPFDRAGHKGKIQNWGEGEETDKGEVHKADSMVIKRQLKNLANGDPHDGYKAKSEDDDEEVGRPLDLTMSVPVRADSKVDCEPQGLASPPGSSIEDFAFGGLADSTYEYLPKQHLLLGGQVGQYKSMYEKAIAAANKWLLYRPMTKTQENILVLGNAKAEDPVTKRGNFKLKPDHSHLLCFAGGMYGLGAKIFDRPDDMEIAKKMTDSCVWAYSVTKTGIMPEDFTLMACDSIDHCPWNQTAWEYTIDPFPEDRIENGLMAMKPQKVVEPEYEAASPADSKATATPKSALQIAKEGSASDKHSLRKRGRDDIDTTIPRGRGEVRGTYLDYKQSQDGSSHKHDRAGGTPTAADKTAKDASVMSQKEYVEHVMDARGLPAGMPYISSRKYILRPEAIESVFYMYRITGDPVWREKGWRMFEAVEKATNTYFGASAILDVMAEYEEITLLDEMESFWLAETLKYFYLLFSTEKTVSLDEYVLNTEAHPFRRPGAKS